MVDSHTVYTNTSEKSVSRIQYKRWAKPRQGRKAEPYCFYSISSGGMSLEYLNQTARNGNRSSRKRTGIVYGLQAEGCVKALWEERRQSRGPVSHKSTSTSEFWVLEHQHSEGQACEPRPAMASQQDPLKKWKEGIKFYNIYPSFNWSPCLLQGEKKTSAEQYSF